jgi:hypothetical protein
VSTDTTTSRLIRYALTHPDNCSCKDPIPVERAERKGAAVTLCPRCGLRVPIRLRR